MMTQLTVNLAERSYPIFIGVDLLKQTEQLLLPYIGGRQLMIVTNERIAPLYLELLVAALSATGQVQQIDTLILPDGESYKNLATLNEIFTALLEKKHHRSTTLLALGGGVIGDLTGFAAATYQRGVAFIQMPTSLLAQVDSSVGGKTGVNHLLGKNMMGAFYQPASVVIDLMMLQTLPKRELAAGLAEVIKYGLIYDQGFFEWIESSVDALLALDRNCLMQAVQRACEIKATIVASDERESGLRAILNFGHTFGHAIEGAMGYGTYLHGEAVAIGMCLATQLSIKQYGLAPEWLARLTALLKKIGLPTTAPKSMSMDHWLQWMQIDKKNLDKKLRLVLLKSCGRATVTDSFEGVYLHEVLAAASS